MTKHTIEYTVGDDEIDVRIEYSMSTPGSRGYYNWATGDGEPPSGPEIEWTSAVVIETAEAITKDHPLYQVIDDAWDQDEDLYIAASERAEGEQQPEPEYEKDDQ